VSPKIAFSPSWGGRPSQPSAPLNEDPVLVAALADVRRQLQALVEGELHRMVGELVLEVSSQRGFQAKAGRARVLGSALLESLPPDDVLGEMADSEQFVTRFRAVGDGLITFLAGELNRGREADGGRPLAPVLARRQVEACVQELRLPAWLL